MIDVDYLVVILFSNYHFIDFVYQLLYCDAKCDKQFHK